MFNRMKKVPILGTFNVVGLSVYRQKTYTHIRSFKLGSEIKKSDEIATQLVGLSGLEPLSPNPNFFLIRESLFKAWVEHLLPFDLCL